jgi:hypothetical protein
MEYQKSNDQYAAVIAACKKEFIGKAGDYGNSLSGYTPFGMFQKIYIKLFRIKTIQQKGVIKVEGETIVFTTSALLVMEAMEKHCTKRLTKKPSMTTLYNQ